MVEVALIVTARVRGGELLNELPSDTPPDPELQSLIDLLAGTEERVWLAGGEPSLRADLPELIQAVRAAGPRVGLVSDALPLAREGAAEPLVAAGLDRVRVLLHAARPDAHDWLVSRPGAARLAVRALGRLMALGVAVEVSATVTRSTLPLLGELIETAAALGARTVHLRRPVGRGRVARELVLLSPRFGLAAPYFEQALAAGARRGVRVTFEGFPECVMPEGARAGSGALLALAPTTPAWDAVRAAVAPPPHEGGCPRCPGLPRCAGAPLDYVTCFGRGEFRSERNATAANQLAPMPSRLVPGVPVDAPPPRHGREPITRLAMLHQVLGKTLDGDPLALLTAEPVPEVLRLCFAAPSRVRCEVCGDHAEGNSVESTRSARARLVRAAQEGARVLRIASTGSLAHPQAASLLRETTLLSFERVELAGEASALDELKDSDLFALRGLSRLDLALYGPNAESHDAHVGRSGAFAASLSAGSRLAELAGAELGAFAVLHDADAVADFARAWEAGALPGEPAFRLSSRGGSLETLARAASALAEGPARRALARVLPTCLFSRDAAVLPCPDPGVAFEDTLTRDRRPSGSDRYGTFVACVCGGQHTPHCPGIAVGWQSTIEP